MTVLSIYNAYQSKLLRYAISLCHDEQTAFDLVQQTFLKALEHEDVLLAYSPARLEGWLIMTVKNAFIDRLRKERSREALFEIKEMVYEEEFMTGFVEEMLLKLPKPIGDCVRMRHFEGMNATEIGEALHIPPATVRTRLRTGAKLLKAEYEKE